MITANINDEGVVEFSDSGREVVAKALGVIDQAIFSVSCKEKTTKKMKMATKETIKRQRTLSWDSQCSK